MTVNVNFAEVVKEECRPCKLPDGARLPESCTAVAQSTINAIKEHGRSNMGKEVCGVLVGSLCWDGEPYLLIDARIEGKFANHQAGSVTFTSETWSYVHEQMLDKYPDKKIVGWYHTHPGFGIFLSNMDFFIHENFFGIKWQPAYVFDPRAEADGFFFWNKGDLVEKPVLVIPDEPPVAGASSLPKTEKIKVTVPEDDKKHPRDYVVSAIVAAIVVAVVVFLTVTCFFLYNDRENLQKKTDILRSQLEREQQRKLCESGQEQGANEHSLEVRPNMKTSELRQQNDDVVDNPSAIVEQHWEEMQQKRDEHQGALMPKDRENERQGKDTSDAADDVSGRSWHKSKWCPWNWF